MAKSLDDRLSWVVECRDSLAVDLSRRDLERDASERYKGFIVRSRLKSVPNEDVKCNMFAREEKVRRFLHRYFEFVKSPDGHALRSNRDMPSAFRVHISYHFACCDELPVQVFCKV